MVAKNYLRCKREAGALQDMLSMYNLLDSDMLPSLKAIIQVALTISVSSCNCERFFNALHLSHGRILLILMFVLHACLLVVVP